MRQTITQFLDELGSSKPSPGGGAAAAMAGALGLSLIEMVARINLERDKRQANAAPQAGAKQRIREVSQLRRKLLAQVPLDTRAFLKLSKFKKEDRQGPRYDAALRTAALVPYEMCLIIKKGILLAEAEMARTSRWLASDLAEAGVLLDASFRSARFNVEVNLKSMKDPSFVDGTRAELSFMFSEVNSMCRKLEGMVS